MFLGDGHVESLMKPSFRHYMLSLFHVQPLNLMRIGLFGFRLIMGIAGRGCIFWFNLLIIPKERV